MFLLSILSYRYPKQFRCKFVLCLSKFHFKWTHERYIENRGLSLRRCMLFFSRRRFKFVHHDAHVRERLTRVGACNGLRCASRPRQGGVFSHPTWRFQFHFLSRRFPAVPPSHLRPPCGSDLGSGVVSHPTPCYSLDAARGCKDRVKEIHNCSLDRAVRSTRLFPLRVLREIAEDHLLINLLL